MKDEEVDLKASKKKNAQLKEKISELEDQLIDKKSNLDYIEELERKLKELELALIAINGLNEKYDLKDTTDIHTS